MSRAKLRCAIYTRKSSEEGLEQEFNSLHAQREACEAYVKSQAGEGWSALPTLYDDGGVSGGMRGVQALKPNLLQFSMMPVPEGVVIPFVDSMIQDGTFHPTEPVEQGAASLLDSLARWADALKVLRED